MLNKIFCAFIFLVFSIIPYTALADLSTEIERMVTCNLNEENPQIATAIKDEKLFKPEGGNFYSPTSQISTFGFNVKYLGLLGVDMVPGPNIAVEGKFKEVKKTILNTINKKFECGPGGCGAEVSPNVQIMIYPHPGDKNLTFIQCGYFGP